MLTERCSVKMAIIVKLGLGLIRVLFRASWNGTSTLAFMIIDD